MKAVDTYLNNLGIASPLGVTQQSVCERLLSNDSGGLVRYKGLNSGRGTWVGRVQESLETIPEHLHCYNCRNNQLLITAYREIANDVELLKQKMGSDRIGIVLGTSTSGIASGEKAFADYMSTGIFPESFDYAQQEIGSASEFLAQYSGVTGINYSISTACSSSGKAIAAGQRLIHADLCDAVIVGGSDSICSITLNGFDALELVSSNICKPFSSNRRGLNIGEGAALFVMTKEPSAIKLSSAGESSDGYHASTPDPTGNGAKRAIEEALHKAALTPQDISYINLHGTATQKNDEMESLAVYEMFPHNPYCSSTKPLTGHALGAASAIELAICWLLLSEYNPNKKLPKQISDFQEDLNLSPINLLSTESQFDKPCFMSNSFGFGGSNVSLIIEKVLAS